jgi:hypothetical protein
MMKREATRMHRYAYDAARRVRTQGHIEHVDRTALLLTMAVATATGIAFGLLPAVLASGTALIPALSFAFFASSQAKYFTAIRVAQRVPIRHTLSSVPVCPPVCPKAILEPSSASQRFNKKRA